MADSKEKNKKRPKILIADISHTVRLLIKRYLEDKYEVLEAETGAEVLSTVAICQPCDSHCITETPKGKEESILPEINPSCDAKDLEMVILCTEFADYSAFEITGKLRKKYHKKCLPIMLNTSNNKREIITKALESGINDFIVKPFPRELLLSKIHKLERDIPLHDIELSKIISTIPLFRNVPESQVAYALNTCSETVTKAKGEPICVQGDTNYDLFVLLEGQCEVLFQEKKVAEILPVDTIGEMGFIGEQMRSATVRAVKPSKVVVFKKDLFDSYLNEERAISETICKNIILSLNNRIKKSNEMVKKLKIMAEEYLSY